MVDVTNGIAAAKPCRPSGIWESDSLCSNICSMTDDNEDDKDNEYAEYDEDSEDNEDDEDDDDDEDDEEDEDDANGTVAQPDSSRRQFSDRHSLVEEEEAYRRELSRPPLFTLSRCE